MQKIRYKRVKLDTKIETLNNYDTDSKKAGWDSPERAQQLVESHIVSGTRVLDIGIGTGLAVRGYTDKGATIIGLDHDKVMLDAARSVVGKNGSLRHADINSRLLIDDLEGSVDVAQAVGVLEFAKDLPSVFDQVYGSLKQDGAFAFALELIDGEYTTEPETHYDDIGVTVYRRTPEEIQNLLEQSGFYLVSMETYDGYERGGAAVSYGIFLAQK